MIPLRDNVARHRLSPVNTLLIAANVAAFAYEMSLGSAAEGFVTRYAMVPALIARAHLQGAMLFGAHGRLWPPFTVLTSMFIHGGVGHVAGNMLYLFIFGPAVEERTGASHYLSFYLLSGIASAAATVAMAPQSMVPVIGASGAIAGILGAYFILYPSGSILTFFPPFFFRVPAVLYLIFWFAAQLYSGIASGAAPSMMGGVAWWAHVGGFLFGVAAGPIAVRPPERGRVARP
ncbi:MAG TPA: rhomboid family intramembrane serine protease [Candidatus Binataceae bacterium]